MRSRTPTYAPSSTSLAPRLTVGMSASAVGSQHDFDPTKLGGQSLPLQSGLLRDLEGCAFPAVTRAGTARLAQRIYTTPVDATKSPLHPQQRLRRPNSKLRKFG